MDKSRIQVEFEKRAGPACKFDSSNVGTAGESAMIAIRFTMLDKPRVLAVSLESLGLFHAAAKIGEQAAELYHDETGERAPREMLAVDRGATDDEIDTVLYLRDGFPFAVAAKVQLKDGRIGIGVARQDPMASGALGLDAMDKAAQDDALENMPKVWIGIDHGKEADTTDLQAQLGQPAHP